MRATTRIAISLSAAALASLVLVGCSGTADEVDSPSTKSPAPTTSASSSPAGGVADDSGACVDGVSTPVKSDATFSLDTCDFVDVMGSSNTITTDALKKLTVEGDGNTITVESVSEITTAGKDNTIYYGGKEPVHHEAGSGTKLMPLSAKE